MSHRRSSSLILSVTAALAGSAMLLTACASAPETLDEGGPNRPARETRRSETTTDDEESSRTPVSQPPSRTTDGTGTGEKPDVEDTTPVTATLPAVISIDPPALAVGAQNPQLTVTGTGITSDAQVLIAGVPATATREPLGTSSTVATLRVSIPPQAIAAPGSLVVTVRTAAGESSASIVRVLAPASVAITALEPASVTAGTRDVAIAATGTGFFAQSTLVVDGKRLATQLVGGQLRATVPATLLAAPRAIEVRADNGSGTESVPVRLLVDVAVPTIASMTPQRVQQDASVQLRIGGTGFVKDLTSVVIQIPGATASVLRATVVSSTELVLPMKVLRAGTASVRVRNTTLGGASRDSRAVSLVVDAPPPTVPPASPTCVDGPPAAAAGQPQYSCEEQKSFGKCEETWMKGFCRTVCGHC